MALGKSVRLFLADGTPGGLLTAEIMNWTGHVFAAPRSDLAALLRRPEATRTGIYILLGDDPDNPGSTLGYIGESDDISKRLPQHNKAEAAGGKDFWDRVIVLTSKDMNLTKAHVKYLESRLITLASAAGRARLANGTNPPLPPLPEADISDMEFFIEQAQIILPVLSVNLLRSTKVSVPGADRAGATTAGALSPVFCATSLKSNVAATAQEVDGEFTVREGSRARAEWIGRGHSYAKLHARLVDEGVLQLVPGGSAREFKRDVVFASPSAAAAIVLGRPANGRTEWRVEQTAQPYGEWQESLVDAVGAAGDADGGA